VLPKHLPRLVSVGRLDFNTEGLLLLTNDGGLARVLEHPTTGWLRRYRVRALGGITQADLDALRDGITIDGMHYGPIEAKLDRPQGANVWLTFAIREGKNREVRNVLGHLGLQVNRLIRLSFGPFQLGELAEGAIEEVRTKVLRDQLGKKIADRAGADFDTPLVERDDTVADRQPQSRRSDERAQGSNARPGRGPAPRKADGPRGGGSPVEGRQRRAPQDDRPRTGQRPPQDGNDGPRQKPRPWRGRHRERPIEPAPESETPRKTKAGLVTDRKGRRVLVQRVQSETPPGKPASPRGRPPRKPSRDRRQGPRPSRPRGRQDKS
jgi:23S rRNA pseudouridine2605 synthase